MRLLIKNRDPFGLHRLWLIGVSFLDIAPYAYDALEPKLMLLGGAPVKTADTIDSHASDLGLIKRAHGIGWLFHQTRCAGGDGHLAWAGVCCGSRRNGSPKDRCSMTIPQPTDDKMTRWPDSTLRIRKFMTNSFRTKHEIIQLDRCRVFLLFAVQSFGQSIAFTFDDGPKLGATPLMSPAERNQAMVDALARHGVKVALFVTVANGADQPEGLCASRVPGARPDTRSAITLSRTRAFTTTR